MINSRKINDEKNVFEGIFRNSIFLIVWIGIFGGQALIVQVGADALKVSKEGLAGEHWAIAIGAGLSTWIAAFFFKFIPDTWCPQFGDKKKDPLADPQHGVLSLRRNRTSSFLRNGNVIHNKDSAPARQGSVLKQVSIN